MKRIGTMVLASLCLFLTGCTLNLYGAGKVSAGMSNQNEAYLSHTVDGDKEGIKASAQLEAKPLTDYLFSEKETPTPPSGD